MKEGRSNRIYFPRLFCDAETSFELLPNNDDVPTSSFRCLFTASSYGTSSSYLLCCPKRRLHALQKVEVRIGEQDNELVDGRNGVKVGCNCAPYLITGEHDNKLYY